MQNKDIFINIIRFFALVLVQVVLLNKINFFGFVNPYLYILFILVYPLSANRSLLILLSFLLGLSVDVFSDSGGIHAAASVFIGYMRPLFLKFAFGVSYEYNMVKLSKTPVSERLSYIVMMVVLHHIILFSLEIFSISNIVLLLKSTLLSTIFTVVLVFCTMILFSRKN